MGRRLFLFCFGHESLAAHQIRETLMLVVVTIKAEIFPVAAVGRVVVVVVVLVVHGKLVQVLAREGAAAAAADPGMEPERLLAVARHAHVALLACFRDDVVELFAVELSGRFARTGIIACHQKVT